MALKWFLIVILLDSGGVYLIKAQLGAMCNDLSRHFIHRGGSQTCTHTHTMTSPQVCVCCQQTGSALLLFVTHADPRPSHSALPRWSHPTSACLSHTHSHTRTGFLFNSSVLQTSQNHTNLVQCMNWIIPLCWTLQLLSPPIKVMYWPTAMCIHARTQPIRMCLLN